MTDSIIRPKFVSVNAWDGTRTFRSPLPAETPWEVQHHFKVASIKTLAAPRAVEYRDWRRPDVGWGLILPENTTLSPKERSTAVDAPAAIGRLVDSRNGAVVLRWRPEVEDFLLRYYEGGYSHDLSIKSPNHGIGPDCIPHYLLIYAPPRQIPWSVQYALNMSTYVGRLDLEGRALENYVDALIGNWGGQLADARAPLVWSVDHGGADITRLMARAIGGKVWEKFESDPELSKRKFLCDDRASAKDLVASLVELTPGLVVTTSHGMTGPLGNGAQLSAQLGCPVDCDYSVIQPADLMAWNPNGAIWYAHACCSAGSDSVSRYQDLFPAGTDIGDLLRGIAAGAGAIVAPLARALLGAEKPLGAFVGHVEPTFDWTLRDTLNGQIVTRQLVSALYNRLYQDYARNPIGWVLDQVYREAGAYFADWSNGVANAKGQPASLQDRTRYCKLVGMDRQTTVIIGDPTVSLAPLSTATS
ncbi:hypothetical protein [Bradyrhizobium monzae]|uniref:hypothetical protein n=1 Tax=Bradyrhizobium sp. Oc8 TaxID=2876780 RepID=UPI001F3E83BA|nr:hypothetical protein [Bradyrhizobium sp. Oc8]